MKITKKFLIIAVFILSTAFNLFSQNQMIIMVKPAGGDLWGYANLKGEMVIPAEYKRCYPFSEGLAVVLNEKTGKYNIITPTGKLLKTDIDKFEVRGPLGGFNDVTFDEGMLAIEVGGKWGYLNSNGKLVIEPQYEKATSFCGGYAVAMNRGRYFIIDKSGKEVAINYPKIKEISYFKEGLAPFVGGGNKGFLDGNGNVVIEPKFQSVGFFHGGLAWAKALNSKLGYINKSGEWVIQPIYGGGKDFDATGGLTVVESAKGKVYINTEGKEVINPSESYHEFSEGLCEGKKDLLWGFFDANGSWVIQPKFDGLRPFRNGYAAAKRNGKWGFIDTSGNWIIDPIFTSVKDVEIY